MANYKMYLGDSAHFWSGIFLLNIRFIVFSILPSYYTHSISSGMICGIAKLNIRQNVE